MAKLKRLLAPAYWKVGKKVAYWVITPSPGPHKKFESIPLGIIVRDILKLVESYREAKKIIKQGEILVDGKPRKSHNYPVGLMDVVSIPKLKQNYRLVVNTKGLKLVKISEEESKLKICRIKSKVKVKGGITQLNLHDGRNILVKEDVYKAGDSLLIEVATQKIVEHIKWQKGNLTLIVKGKNAGKTARIENILTPKFRQPPKAICKIGEQKFEVLGSHVLVVGAEKSLISLGE
ncbi:MAG: 30S ribosomal protein S4e [Candidatus Aenigmarchaeota archaeon]|nr:30S ribosomal protein S4e [Candidatus Aenigmarchaeota archaeon]